MGKPYLEIRLLHHSESAIKAPDIKTIESFETITSWQVNQLGQYGSKLVIETGAKYLD